MDGLIRCHYPLGDATRDARIAADRRAAEAGSAASAAPREVVS
jgi:dipeptide transport system ATP-binding protein